MKRNKPLTRLMSIILATSIVIAPVNFYKREISNANAFFGIAEAITGWVVGKCIDKVIDIVVDIVSDDDESDDQPQTDLLDNLDQRVGNIQKTMDDMQGDMSKIKTTLDALEDNFKKSLGAIYEKQEELIKIAHKNGIKLDRIEEGVFIVSAQVKVEGEKTRALIQSTKETIESVGDDLLDVIINEKKSDINAAVRQYYMAMGDDQKGNKAGVKSKMDSVLTTLLSVDEYFSSLNKKGYELSIDQQMIVYSILMDVAKYNDDATEWYGNFKKLQGLVSINSSLKLIRMDVYKRLHSLEKDLVDSNLEEACFLASTLKYLDKMISANNGESIRLSRMQRLFEAFIKKDKALNDKWLDDKVRIEKKRTKKIISTITALNVLILNKYVRPESLNALRSQIGWSVYAVNPDEVGENKAREYRISNQPITVTQYQKCVDTGVCKGFKDTCKPNNVNGFAACLDWVQARTYAKWLGGDLLTDPEYKLSSRTEYEWLLDTPEGATLPTCKKYDCKRPESDVMITNGSKKSIDHRTINKKILFSVKIYQDPLADIYKMIRNSLDKKKEKKNVKVKKSIAPQGKKGDKRFKLNSDKGNKGFKLNKGSKSTSDKKKVMQKPKTLKKVKSN